MDVNVADLGAGFSEAVQQADTQSTGESWWGGAFHVTPGDLHVKHFAEPNDRDYES
jgi:hypothetical protein